ncbi:hypothetical protein Lal_00012040 [Lupinus albus]|nr:hypothetical protein Lal_00012040 [Lupinus albus]
MPFLAQARQLSLRRESSSIAQDFTLPGEPFSPRREPLAQPLNAPGDVGIVGRTRWQGGVFHLMAVREAALRVWRARLLVISSRILISQNQCENTIMSLRRFSFYHMTIPKVKFVLILPTKHIQEPMQ